LPSRARKLSSALALLLAGRPLRASPAILNPEQRKSRLKTINTKKIIQPFLFVLDFHFQFVITIFKNFLVTIIEFQDFEIK
jgi:hypothetical protein